MKEAEKLAEEYLHNEIDIYEEIEMNDIKKSFLAGYEAGKPKWHDLRKDPKDLPPKERLGSIEVYIAYSDGITDFAYYRFDTKEWRRSETDEDTLPVIAWCEIPKFEK